jgi:CxxC motif-containing protein (DUF1111 family)
MHSFRLMTGIVISGLVVAAATIKGPAGPVDPGVRQGASNAGQPLPGLTADEMAFFADGASRFVEVETVTGGPNIGLGPRFNGNQCAQCHAQPAIGGSSPSTNPLLAAATLQGGKNVLPWFIYSEGPIREVRFKKNPNGTVDGGVHAMFVISGRSDAPGCNIAQPNFGKPGNPKTGYGGNSNLAFRIATPVFGLGLIEAIPDSTILNNMTTDSNSKRSYGIGGHPNAEISGVANRSANDGTITRFGWKAQNKSLLVFAGEAYNVEMGITNMLFPQERDYTPGCIFNATPEDATNFTPPPGPNGAPPPYAGVLSDIEAFGNFMRMLAPPAPAADTYSTIHGRALFSKVGCALCHTPTLMTAKQINSGGAAVPSAALSNQPVHLYSDVLVHRMGNGLADGISQGGAGVDEFRTAPLWGVGQRIYFLHDGRTSDLVEAIYLHKSPHSEASRVVDNFRRLKVSDQQDIINFLRGL